MIEGDGLSLNNRIIENEEIGDVSNSSCVGAQFCDCTFTGRVEGCNFMDAKFFNPLLTDGAFFYGCNFVNAEGISAEIIGEKGSANNFGG